MLVTHVLYLCGHFTAHSSDESNISPNGQYFGQRLLDVSQVLEDNMCGRDWFSSGLFHDEIVSIVAISCGCKNSILTF